MHAWKAGILVLPCTNRLSSLFKVKLSYLTKIMKILKEILYSQSNDNYELHIYIHGEITNSSNPMEPWLFITPTENFEHSNVLMQDKKEKYVCESSCQQRKHGNWQSPMRAKKGRSGGGALVALAASRVA